jgi:hypothetical protein
MELTLASLTLAGTRVNATFYRPLCKTLHTGFEIETLARSFNRQLAGISHEFVEDGSKMLQNRAGSLVLQS